MSDLKTGRGTPPSDDEWQGIWHALEKAEKGWVVTAPFHAIVTNWKALAAIAGVIVWFNSDEIILIIREIAGLPL